MRLRSFTYLIRTVLILISFQFLAPAFLTDSPVIPTANYVNFLHKHSGQTASFASLLEKTEKESEEEERDKFLAAEILDLFTSYAQRITASQTILSYQAASEHLQELPLFDLYCIYRI